MTVDVCSRCRKMFDVDPVANKHHKDLCTQCQQELRQIRDDADERIAYDRAKAEGITDEEFFGARV